MGLTHGWNALNPEPVARGAENPLTGSLWPPGALPGLFATWAPAAGPVCTKCVQRHGVGEALGAVAMAVAAGRTWVNIFIKLKKILFLNLF